MGLSSFYVFFTEHHLFYCPSDFVIAFGWPKCALKCHMLLFEDFNPPFDKGKTVVCLEYRLTSHTFSWVQRHVFLNISVLLSSALLEI